MSQMNYSNGRNFILSIFKAVKSFSNNVNPREAHWGLIIYRLLKHITQRSSRYLRSDLFLIYNGHDGRATEHGIIRCRRRPTSSSFSTVFFSSRTNGISHKRSRASYLAVSRIIFGLSSTGAGLRATRGIRPSRDT